MRKIWRIYRHKFYPQPLLNAFFNFSHKRPTFAFTSKNTHSAFGERSHTAAHTAKRGRSGWGRYHYPRSVPHVHKHPRAGRQNGELCRFWALAGGALEERREPSEQRCAHARRCSAGVAALLGCVALLPLFVQYDLEGYPKAEQLSESYHLRMELRCLSLFGSAILALPASLSIDFSGAKYVRTFALNKISHKRFTFAFTVKSEYTLGCFRTIAHNGSHAETWSFTLADMVFSHSWAKKSWRKWMHACDVCPLPPVPRLR